MKGVFIRLFKKKYRDLPPIECEFSPKNQALLDYAHYICTTDDLVLYLSALTDDTIINVLEKSRHGFFTSYLLQLENKQFNLESWNRGLSLLYGQKLRFGSINQAKTWLYQHRNVYTYRTEELW